MTDEPPVRLCCFQRHYGPVCADDHFMCCLCFERFPVAEAFVDDDGPCDVCRDCGAREAAVMAARLTASDRALDRELEDDHQG